VLVSQCSTATNGDQSGVTLLGEDRHESILPTSAGRHDRAHHVRLDAVCSRLVTCAMPGCCGTFGEGRNPPMT